MIAEIIKSLELSRVKESCIPGINTGRVKQKVLQKTRLDDFINGSNACEGFLDKRDRRILKRDKFWRRSLGFKKKDPDYTSFSDFLERIGAETFAEVFRILPQQLTDMSAIQLNTVADILL